MITVVFSTTCTETIVSLQADIYHSLQILDQRAIVSHVRPLHGELDFSEITPSLRSEFRFLRTNWLAGGIALREQRTEFSNHDLSSEVPVFSRPVAR